MLAEITVTFECSVCHDLSNWHESGVCHICRQRIPQIGGCGLASVVALALIAGGPDSVGARHLLDCADCREALEAVSNAVSVAMMEAAESEAEMERGEAEANAAFFSECDRIRDEKFDDHVYHESFGSLHDWAESEMGAVA